MDSRAKKRVLACRPEEQNAGWRQKLEGGGFDVLDIPLLEIVALTDPGALQGIKKRITNLDSYDGVIFVSQNAVALAFDWIEQYWPQLPLGVRFHAVGRTTSEAVDRRVARMGGGPARQSDYDACAAMDSEALLARLVQPGEIHGKKFLICRGAGGRPMLGEELVRHGATVDYCELYQRQLPAAALEKFQQTNLNPARDLLAVFSGETLDNLVTVLKQSGVPAWRDIPIVVPGKRVEEKARANGFKQIITARNATDESMFNTLVKFTSETN